MIVPVKGVTFEGRQNVLARMYGRPELWRVIVRREAKNPYDPNAVGVYAEGPQAADSYPRGVRIHKVGYLPRDLAKRLKGRRVWVKGWELVGKEILGLRLELEVR